MSPHRTRLQFDPVTEARRHWLDQGWEAAAEGMTAVTSIMRAQQIMLARVDEQLKPLALTFARYEVLMLLTFSSQGALPMGVMGSRLQVHPTSITNAVDRLETADLVRREPHPDDRRAVLVQLTQAGRELALAATARLNRSVFEDLGIGANETRDLIEALTALRRSAGDF